MKEHQNCSVCGKRIHEAMYMVKQNVWTEAGFVRHDLVHMKCLITKLGRPLIYRDFNGAVINDVWTAGMKMPCCFCLFEEMKLRYRLSGHGLDATFAKLKLAHHGDRYPTKKMVVDKCTCE
jgi:hypothetical protein